MTYLHQKGVRMNNIDNISFDDKTGIFQLNTKNMSYVIQVYRDNYLAHIYWGRTVKSYRGSNALRFKDRAFSPNPDNDDRDFSLDTLPQEYPAFGNTDFRLPAFQVECLNGSTITDLRYKDYKIYKGKRPLEGLPSTYVELEEEAQTLEIHLEDTLVPLHVYLTYTVFKDYDAITRSVRIVNGSDQKMKLLRVLSASVDFRNSDFDLLQLSGAWGRERDVIKKSLDFGVYSVESRRGASSHQQNPFLALMQKEANETTGEVFGLSFVYSGNFLAQVEVDQFSNTRVSMGINPFGFSWLLDSGCEFQTPEVVMVYSANGLGDLSRTYHQLYQRRLCRGIYRDQIRPVLINNWEATYFDFNADNIIELAKKAKPLGIEMVVLDDGWFGRRDDDKSSLGDWVVNETKLSNGLNGLANEVEKLDLKFGLWFEPEMISVDSELYRKHPDWCLHVPDRNRSEGRSQLVLDFSRAEVCEAVATMVKKVLKSAPISYVKWDMNRHMTEVGSASLPPERQKETAHRYILGLYRVLEEIVNEFPHILFESCSGGGGRFDPGMLYYMPQTWTSDNTDAVERLKIQYGTSIVYPISSMCAHVSAVPNHQVGRITSLKMRGDVAMAGNFGYELDITQLPQEELDVIEEQIRYYKEIRPLIQFGNFYRLLSPFDGGDAAWMFVSLDKSEACMFYYKVTARANEPFKTVRLQGLSGENEYLCVGDDAVFGGDELMHIGINVPVLDGDYQSFVLRLSSI